MFDYTIPDKIKSRIPEYFYYALGGEYVSIMGGGRCTYSRRRWFKSFGL